MNLHEPAIDNEHPIRQKLVQYGRDQDEWIGDAFEADITFMAPNVVILSFAPEEWRADFNERRHHSTHGFAIYESDKQEKVVDTLADFCSRLSVRPLCVLDYRGVRHFDLPSAERNFLALGRASLNPHILTQDHTFVSEQTIPNDRNFSDSGQLVERVVEERLRREEHYLHIRLKAELNLQALEDAEIAEPQQGEAYSSALVVDVDASNLNVLTSFGMFALRMTLESQYLEHGILSKIRFPNASGSRETMLNHGYRAELRGSMDVHAPQQANRAVFTHGRDTFLASIGPTVSRSKLLDGINIYLAELTRSFELLTEYRSYTRERPFTSHKTYTGRLPVFHLLRLILIELTENATLYANGPLTVALSHTQGVLSICVGDLGVGLRSGILANYDLADRLVGDVEALEMAFQLPQHQDKRRDLNRIENKGSGFGLFDCLHNVERCGGRVAIRSGSAVAAFMDRVRRTTAPSKIVDSSYYTLGTQFMIVAPLDKSARRRIPRTFNDMMERI